MRAHSQGTGLRDASFNGAPCTGALPGRRENTRAWRGYAHCPGVMDSPESIPRNGPCGAAGEALQPRRNKYASWGGFSRTIVAQWIVRTCPIISRELGYSQGAGRKVTAD